MATELCCWWPLSEWISPGAALFVFINVLVGAIAVTSREQPCSAPASRRRLCRRSASSIVLDDRLLSFSMFPVVHRAAECAYQPSQEEEDEQWVVSGSASEPPVQGPAAAAEPPASAPAAEALAADGAASMSETHTDEVGTDEASVQEQSQQRRAPGLVPRPAPVATAAADEEEATAAVERPRNRKRRSKVAAKRSTQGRGRASHQEAEEAEGKSAELKANVEFKLQRLNSIINYTRELRCRSGIVAVAPERS